MKLNLDKNFIPATAKDNDEVFSNGIFEFNITLILNFIEQNRELITLEEINVDEYYQSYFRINEDHIENVDINKPILLIEISPNKYNIIDGHHRLTKAKRLGVKTIMAYKLRAEQCLDFFTASRGYISFIEYWNGKAR